MDHRTAFPTRIEITEVGMRDGLQMEASFVPTETKARLIKRLVDAGVRQIEATSFVSPRAVPALRDAAELIASIERRADVTISVLAPNRKGIERAVAADVDEVVVFLSASESHNRKNLNRSIADSLNDMREAADVVRGTGMHLKGAIAVAFGCPFEGNISLDTIASIATRFADLGFSSVTLGDTTGMATPTNVRAAVTRLQQALPDMPINLHFHNTRGLGLVNVMEGLSLGITSYESSLGGIGGCPFAPGATGNVCTEDTVNLMNELGIDTGIDLAKLCEVARDLEGVLAHPLSGQVMRAGPRLRSYALEEQVAAVG